MGIIEISVALIALAFTALVIYVIITLSSVRKSLDHANQTMSHMKSQVDKIHDEATELMHNTNHLMVDIKEKVQALNSVVHSIRDLGMATQQVTTSIKQVSTTISDTVQKTFSKADQKKEKIAEVLRYATLGLKFWQDWQARKEKQMHKQDYASDSHKPKE